MLAIEKKFLCIANLGTRLVDVHFHPRVWVWPNVFSNPHSQMRNNGAPFSEADSSKVTQIAPNSCLLIVTTGKQITSLRLENLIIL